MIRIGVTGHRVLAEPEKLDAAVDEVASMLARAFPGERWEVLSSLAEGADRLVARRLMARPGTRLAVILPLPPGDYVSDFDSDQSKREFRDLLSRADEVVDLPPVASRDAAYEAAGDAVLDRADVLIALWDGRGAQGRGGTAHTVARARGRALALAWVHAGNRRPGTLAPSSLGAEQGKVTFERLPARGQRRRTRAPS